MRYKPFLCHKRQKAAAVTYLKRQLCIRGAGGWQDTSALPMGGIFLTDIERAIKDDTLDIAITAFREPTEEHALTLDWRSLFNADTRTLEPGAVETIIEALGDIREALQSRERSPQLSVEIALPLPLAMLVGHEWRRTTQLRVTVKTVNPGDGELLSVEPTATAPGTWLLARTATLPGSGPFVLGVSVGPSLGATIDRYAADHDARGFEHVHVDRDCEKDPLDADEVRALAAHVVKRLNTLQSDGAPKHLLLRAPASLATAIGLAANGTGPTCVPFYDGHDYYVGGLWIG